MVKVLLHLTQNLLVLVSSFSDNEHSFLSTSSFPKCIKVETQGSHNQIKDVTNE